MPWLSVEPEQKGNKQGMSDQLDTRHIGELFEHKGLRWTVQRQLILQIVQNQAGHLTVEDIYREISQTYPTVNRTTIYRTLETLRELGVVVQVNSHGELRRYELVSHKPHYHAMCENCGGEVEIPNAEIAQIQAEILERHGLRLQLEHFVGYTLCSACRAANPSLALDLAATHLPASDTLPAIPN